MTSSDAEIISLLESDETRKQGFKRLVALHSEKLYWQVRRIVLTHDDANDVVQNALIKAWINIDRFQQRSNIYTWLSRIAINEALDHVRERQKMSSVSTDEPIAVADKLMADEYFDGDETQAQLMEAVSKLPDVQRAVFSLRYFEEMKFADISRVLNTTEGALKASYHHAVKKIEAFFRQRD